jgi:hypothetical protein
MSTTVAEQSFAAKPKVVALDLQAAEFDYRPTPIIVPICVTLGVLSVSSLLGVVGILIALIGTVTGVFAVLKVRSGEGMFSGMWGALAGFVMSLGFALVGITSQVYAYQTEVPEGFRRVSFSQDISAKGFQVTEGKFGLHPDVAELLDQKVFLKGYMYPQRQTQGLMEFLLLKDTGECCFGGQPNPTDMILVQMQNPQGANYSQGRVAVAGTFKLTKNTTPEGLQPVYALEVVKFERSRSAF